MRFQVFRRRRIRCQISDFKNAKVGMWKVEIIGYECRGAKSFRPRCCCTAFVFEDEHEYDDEEYEKEREK